MEFFIQRCYLIDEGMSVFAPGRQSVVARLASHTTGHDSLSRLAMLTRRSHDGKGKR